MTLEGPPPSRRRSGARADHGPGTCPSRSGASSSMLYKSRDGLGIYECKVLSRRSDGTVDIEVSVPASTSSVFLSRIPVFSGTQIHAHGTCLEFLL